jgi:hypothetical protein
LAVLDTGLVARDRLNAHLDAVLVGGREWEDINHYADTKGPLIAAILERVTI